MFIPIEVRRTHGTIATSISIQIEISKRCIENPWVRRAGIIATLPQ